MTLLILTVGGSCEPLVNAIRAERPDFVYFVCSSGSKGSHLMVDGPGEPCVEHVNCRKITRPSIAVQTGLEEGRYQKWEVDDPDSLAHCYGRLMELADKIREHFGAEHPRIVANYTGGTKTMSVALALVAMIEENWELQLNKGPRVDLVKVRGGDVPILINKWEVFADHILNAIKESLSRYDYAEAAELASDALKRPLSEERQNRFQRIYTLARAFEAWDRFDHEEAYKLLEPFAKDFVEHKIALERILGRNKRVSGYEKVGDLIRNAERRAIQSRYDDAVARLYRALELFAQLRLKQILPIGETERGNAEEGFKIPLESLPKGLRDKYGPYIEKGVLKIGLVQDYELLADLEDLVGLLFQKQKEKMLNGLKQRNYSILAHGLSPLTEMEYKDVRDMIVGFIEETAKEIEADFWVPQLPTEF